MTTALVTGSEGFIGRHIVEELCCRGYDVRTLDIVNADRPSHVLGSVCDQQLVTETMHGIDVVYHLAAVLGTSELISRNATANDVNVLGTIRVLQAAVDVGVGRVFYPAKPNIWLNTYSITKDSAEQFALMYRKYHELDSRVLRWYSAYGPGQKLWPIRKVFPIVILQALHQLPIEVYGSGQQNIEMIYSADMRRVTVDYMEATHVPDRIMDMGCVRNMSVNGLANLIRHLAGSTSPIVHLPMRIGETEDIEVAAETEAASAADMLGLEPSTTEVVDGMAATIDYYRRLDPSEHKAALEFYYGTIPADGDTTAATIRQYTSFVDIENPLSYSEAVAR